MIQSFKVSNVQMSELFWRWVAPILLLSKIEAGEAGKPLVPAVPRGIHGHSDVGVVFEEGYAVSERDGCLPPAEVSLAGLVEDDRRVDRCS